MKNNLKSGRIWMLTIGSLLPMFLSLLLLTNCQSKEAVKRDQYIAEGFNGYQTHCANCHQADGKGLAGLYPPITADFLKNKNDLACLIRYGMSQPIVVNGKSYNRPMPANPTLKELDVAEIVTYVQVTWGNPNAAMMPVDSAKTILERCQLGVIPEGALK
jgi:mono/diheme cytochrome c family protein